MTCATRHVIVVTSVRPPQADTPKLTSKHMQVYSVDLALCAGIISRRCFAQRSARHEVVPKFQRRGAWSDRNHPDHATPGHHSCGMNNMLLECNARSCQSCYSLLPSARGCGEWAACLPAPEHNGRWARAELSWGIDFPAVCMQVHTYGDWGPMTVLCPPHAA